MFEFIETNISIHLLLVDVVVVVDVVDEDDVLDVVNVVAKRERTIII